MKKILTHRFLGIALLAVVVFGITLLFPAHFQSQKPFASANVAYAILIPTTGLCTNFPDPRCVLENVTAACVTGLESTPPDKSKCTNDDTTILRQVASCSPERGFWSSFTEIGVGFVCSDTQKQQSARAADLYANTNMSCSGLFNYWSNPLRCTTRLLSVGLGGLLVSLSAWLLALADMLFRWTVDNTILLFSTSIFDNVKNGVNTGWTAMRDIANILIIGVFTFIAISTILSIEEYGAKKLLARVLVIAVIINFSLLFTKIIIDASNFTAGQFYASASGVSLGTARDDATKRDKGTDPVPKTAGVSDSVLSFRNVGFSGAFLNFMKITSVGDTLSALSAKAEDQGGWSALAHGILSAVVLLGAACVLFYGSYLLINRAVLFIFLMVTAAGAFATHLIPGMTDSTYGWKGWWSSLLHNAALAPILMILLWITLTVSSKLSSVNGTLGALGSATVPGSTDTATLFSYFIILGLLFGSFKLSSKWASKTGGLNFTGTMLKTAAVGTAAVASRFVAAPILRQTVGRFATGRSLKLTNDIKEKTEYAAKIGDKHPDYAKTQKEIYGLKRQQRYVDKAAAGSFNLGNVGVVNAGAKMLKVPGIVAGRVAQKKPQGFQGAMEERLKKEMEDAEKLVRRPREVEDTLMKEHLAGKTVEGAKYNADMDTLRNAADVLRQTLEKTEAATAQNLPRLETDLADAEAKKKASDADKVAAETQKATVITQKPYTDLNVEHRGAEAELAAAQANRATLVSNSETKVNDLKTIIASKPGQPNSQEVLDAQAAIVSEERSRETALVAQDEKIKTARTESTRIKADMDKITQPLDTVIQKATTDAAGASLKVSSLQTEIDKLNEAQTKAEKDVDDKEDAIRARQNKLAQRVRDDAAAIVKGSGQIAEDYAVTKVHHRWTNIIPRAIFNNTEENDTMSLAMRKAAKAGIRDVNLKDQMKAWNALQREIGGGGGGGTSTGPVAPAPSAGAAPSAGPAAPSGASAGPTGNK